MVAYQLVIAFLLGMLMRDWLRPPPGGAPRRRLKP